MSDADKQPYKKIMEILASDAFKSDLQILDCYDTEETGKIIWG
jgi:molybdate-binding protein